MANHLRRSGVIEVPEWVPESAVIYLAHVESGRSLRSLARETGCHASTILRRVRRYETRRDDLLIDLALRRLGTFSEGPTRGAHFEGGTDLMQPAQAAEPALIDDGELRRTAPRLLRRLNEAGACLAIARDMENAVIVREGPDGQTLRTAVLERYVAEAMALNEWIALSSEGRITRYRITSAGRTALKQFMAEDETRCARLGEAGEASPDRQNDWAERNSQATGNKKRGIRYNAAESPLSALARRKDKDGKQFLSPEQVAAGERLREDFELAQMNANATQNLESFLTAASNDQAPVSGDANGTNRARDRVITALSDLGPGLGDVVLRCCCFLEGMESVERRMGWSARSGKIVLRIALLRLRAHYDEKSGNWSPLIG